MAAAEVKHPDPTALGLFGLGVVTLVASSQKLEITAGLSYVIPWAIFLGAIAQLIAGILDYKKGNVFGGTAFCAYGVFWLGMALSWLINMGAFGAALQNNVDAKQMGFAFVAYFVLSVFLTIGATSTNKVLFIIFFFIDLLFLGLFISTLMPGSEAAEFFHKLAAVSELAIAIFSLYGSGANVLNNTFNRPFIPIGKPFGGLKK